MKYGNRKTEYDGITFDSQHEAQRWYELKMLQRAGKISGLRRQVPYELIPNQKDEKGRVAERKVTYIADFVYFDNEKCREVVEDAKGFKTEVYRLKKKLMRHVYGVIIREV